jgi:hypothetical protein
MSTTSQKYRDAEQLVPDPLKPIFARLVSEYEFLTSVHYGRGYVAYRVLAELVLAGWRPTGVGDPRSKLNSKRNKE